MERHPLVKRGLVLIVVFFSLGIANIQAFFLGTPFDDTTPPMTTATMNPEFHNGWYPLPVWVTLNATDNESGVNTTYYKIDSGGWGIYTQPIMIVDDGVFVVQFYSVDNVGNAEVPKHVDLKIDCIPPTTSCFLDPLVPNGLNGWYVSNITVTLNATDNESGVWRTYCNGEIYTKPINITGEGSPSIIFYSIDNVVNVEFPQTIPAFKIDKTPPVICLNYTWERVGFRRFVIILTATCSDAMSGMDRVEFYKNGELQETVSGAGPDYEWRFPWPLFGELHVKGLICNLTMTDEVVTFFAFLVINSGFPQDFPNLRAYAYDWAGNQDFADIEQPCHRAANSVGVYKYLSLFKYVTLPNNYDGYLGDFLIDATFYNP